MLAYRHEHQPPPKLVRTFVLPTEKTGFVVSSPPALSDGRKLAFAAAQEGKSALWIRDLD